MFTYIDPTVRERLIAQGKLVRIDAAGQAIDASDRPEPGDKAISILGP
ncbi:MAG: GTP cyclohydrolase II, partial [Gammaproteobacteria bacterium]